MGCGEQEIGLRGRVIVDTLSDPIEGSFAASVSVAASVSAVVSASAVGVDDERMVMCITTWAAMASVITQKRPFMIT